MADDRHYVGGEWYRICDRTGFKIRDVKTRKEWTNRIVREQSWEPRQPQDFVQGVMDDQTVVDPRPRQVDQFQGPLITELIEKTLTGGYFIKVYSSVRMFPNDILSIMLDNGETFRVSIYDILNDNLIQLNAVLPWSASVGNRVIDTSAVSTPVVIPYSGAAL